MIPSKPNIVGSTTTRASVQDSANSLPACLRKLVNYEYRNSLAAGRSLQTPISLLASPVLVKKEEEDSCKRESNFVSPVNSIAKRTRLSCRQDPKAPRKHLYQDPDVVNLTTSEDGTTKRLYQDSDVVDLTTSEDITIKRLYQDPDVVDLTTSDDDTKSDHKPVTIDLSGDDVGEIEDKKLVIDLTNKNTKQVSKSVPPASKPLTRGELFSGQAHVTSYDRDNLDNCNVILPYNSLIDFLDTNFLCRQCKKNEKIVYERQTVGIATSN
jgi:hypothetical protein